MWDCITYLVEVDVQALELKVRGAVVAVVIRKGHCPTCPYHLHSRAVKAMLAGDDLPVTGSELSSKTSKSRLRGLTRRQHQFGCP
jgi:hypothetical protein